MSDVVDFRFHTEYTGWRRAIGIDITGIQQREKFEVTQSRGRVGGDVRIGIKQSMDDTRGGGSIRIVLLLLIVPRMFGNLAHPRGIIRILITTLNFDLGLDLLAISILGRANKIMIRTYPWCFVLLLAELVGLTTSSKFKIVSANDGGDCGGVRRQRKCCQNRDGLGEGRHDVVWGRVTSVL